MKIKDLKKKLNESLDSKPSGFSPLENKDTFEFQKDLEAFIADSSLEDLKFALRGAFFGLLETLKFCHHVDIHFLSEYKKKCPTGDFILLLIGILASNNKNEFEKLKKVMYELANKIIAKSNLI